MVLLQYKDISSIRMQQQVDPSPQKQTSSYLQTQFFFYMLTSYYALVSFSIRYNKIMRDAPQKNINRIPGQFLIQCLENQPQFVPGAKDQPIPASYVIKSKLCLLNAYLYLFMALFSLIGTEDVFYACKHRRYGVIYLFGFAAWTMAAIVLRRQFMRNLNQSLWTHRIFWIFSGTFAVTKMFQDYLLPINFALNIISITSNFVLAIYGIYRPEDNDTITLIDNQQIPSMFKIFFQYIELNPLLRKLLRIEQPSSTRINQQLQVQNMGEIDLNTLQQAFKVTTESRREQINLLNQLPRRNIFIDKKLQYIKNNNGNVKVCYFVFSQIGNDRFQASRTYQEFVKLETQLEAVFNQKNFPKTILPKIRKNQTSEISNQSDVLEQWLVEVVKKPLFMIKPLLVFLNINQQCSAPFLTYFDVSYRSFCSNTFMLAQLRKKEAKTNRVSLVGYFDEQAQTSTPSSARISTLIKQKLQFVVQVDEDITDPKQFGFIFTCLRQLKSKQKIRWKLLKYEQNIMQVNRRIEDQCKISIPFFYTMSAGLSKNHKNKAIAFRDYIQKLLSDERYYCVSLFQFIRFDPIAMEVKIGGMDAGLSKGQADKTTARVSHYFQQYEDHEENMVVVLRVDRIDSESKNVEFKFQIRRKSFTMFRTSQQLVQLRKQLAELYYGVCFIPVISYQDCNKYEAKQRTQKFLNALQGLPKITINESFAKFYYHTL